MSKDNEKNKYKDKNSLDDIEKFLEGDEIISERTDEDVLKNHQKIVKKAKASDNVEHFLDFGLSKVWTIFLGFFSSLYGDITKKKSTTNGSNKKIEKASNDSGDLNQKS